MLAQLLESQKRTKRSVWGAVVSTLAHTAVIAIAVVATAQARVDAARPPEIVRWVRPPVAPNPAAASQAARRTATQSSLPTPKPLALDRIDVVIPPIDLTVSVPTHDGVPFGRSQPTPGGDADSSGAPGSADAFSAEQVERRVTLRRGTTPRYPNSLRASGVEGEVVALFVVSEAGRVEPASIRFVRSDNLLFEAAVREALADMRFNPAQVSGRNVRQLVQMPFVFTLKR